MATVSTLQEPTLSRSGRKLVRLLENSGIACTIHLPSGESLRIGSGKAKFTATIHSEQILRRSLDEFSLGRAYAEGDIDFEGDMLAVLETRKYLKDNIRILPSLKLLSQLLFLPSTWINRHAIGDHYSLGNEFYLSFTDENYHFYSHCVFHSDDETLEQAAEHKLEQMFDALQLRPGMRVLDIGGGWGAAIKYCAPRGVHVTSLTIVNDSHEYIRQQIREGGLQGEVLLEDFLVHDPIEPYDAIVIYGVIEHIPMYRRFARQVWKCLKPSGRLYVDGSATKEKFDMSTFTRNYTWHGTHTFLCLQDLMAELLYHGMEIVRVRQETHDYELTMRHWAERFDACHDEIKARWGEKIYRAHRMFLWGGCHAFQNDWLQAYHLVAQRRSDPGPRPGPFERFYNFCRSLT